MKTHLLTLVGWLTVVISLAQTPKPAPTEPSKEQMEQMEQVLGKPKKNIRTIGILIYDGVNELDVMGPRYVLGQSMGAKTQLIGLKPGPVKTVMGVTLVPDNVIDSVHRLDILVIPGGFRGTVDAVYDEVLHAWIRKIDQTTQYTASVCTGGWVLGATGLLKGKRASTNWFRENEMLTKYGAIPAHERYTHDGKYWTSAGVTAGMDMSLALLKEIWGEQYTQAVMLDMEYDPQPPLVGGSPEKSSPAVLQMMQAMYGGALQPLIDAHEGAKNKPAANPLPEMPNPAVKKTGKKSAMLPRQPNRQPQAKSSKKRSNPAKTAHLPIKTIPAGLLAEGTDPVCHMTVPKGTSLTTMFGGKQYGFCSEMCRKRFLQEPATYTSR